MSPGAYQSILQTNYNQADRAKAFEAFLETYGATANTYAAIYNGVMQKGWFTAQARNFPATLDAALEGNAVPPAVVKTLVDTVHAGTAPLQRYVKLRKKLLGLDIYHLYDGSIPIDKTDRTTRTKMPRNWSLRRPRHWARRMSQNTGNSFPAVVSTSTKTRANVPAPIRQGSMASVRICC